MSWISFYIFYIVALAINVIFSILFKNVKSKWLKYIVVGLELIPIIVFLPIIIPTLLMWYYHTEINGKEDEESIDVEITPGS